MPRDGSRQGVPHDRDMLLSAENLLRCAARRPPAWLWVERQPLADRRTSAHRAGASFLPALFHGIPLQITAVEVLVSYLSTTFGRGAFLWVEATAGGMNTGLDNAVHP